MIFDKEYPATHSMSTAWYMVDADGNVGLMNFDDNGPVPEFNQVSPEATLTNLVFGQEFSSEYICEGIHLNADQIHELLGAPRKPENISYWFQVCLAVVPEYTAEFLSLCKNNDITCQGCVSPDMNLYFVDAFDCIDNNRIKVGSTLDKMMKANMIKAIYQVPELDVDSIYDPTAKSVVFTKDFENTPYYIYCQSYWTSELQHRMNIPLNPVKITQIDGIYHKKLLYLPIRFKDAEDLQIAQWFVCKSSDSELVINNAGYSLFPIDKHSNKYCLTSPFLFDFYEYCPYKKSYQCNSCTRDCVSTVRQINSLTPNILYVVPPTINHNDLNLPDSLQELKDKVAVFSYIPKFPYKLPRYWMEINSIKDQMTVDNLSSILSSSKAWFEKVVHTINPQVIIINDEALSILSSVFPIVNNEILIDNSKYPIFKESTLMENNEYIVCLAKMPYRGQLFRMTYTESEVNDLKQNGNAFEIKW